MMDTEGWKPETKSRNNHYPLHTIHFFLRSTIISILLIVALILNLSAQDTSRVTMLFAGDIMGHGPQIHAAWDSANDSYDYTPVFQFIKPIIEKADIAVANLEVTLA